jgi:hypothetical protein
VRYVDDPIRPANEVSLNVTRPVLDWIVVPVAKGYRLVVPPPVRHSLDRFAYNATFPGRCVSLLLQGELRKSASETGRFLTNTTVGVAGLFDPASQIGIDTYREDVGQAFARWGIGAGAYLFIPLVGPSSARDAVGGAFDLALNPFIWLPIPGVSLFFNLPAVMGTESFRRYLDERAFPYLARRLQRPTDAATLAADAGLRSRAGALRRQPRARVITTADDFLLDDADRRWLRATFGDRLTVLPDGGHLGHLGEPYFRDEMMAALGGPLPPREVRAAHD